MTKEVRDILAAYKDAKQHGRLTALATVVHVEGSSYRRPGARMLVEDTGKITGAISGGCLEGDALKKALLAINQQQNKLVTYNTLLEDDIEFGVQLGCNGIVHILFEPIDPEQDNNPIALLEKCFLQRKDAVIVTLFSLKNFYGHQPGTCYFFNDEQWFSTIKDQTLENEIMKAASTSYNQKYSTQQLCGKEEFTAFVEWMHPPISLNIIGAGNDALPLVEMASVLGWQITIIDGRQTHANKQRFLKADKIIIGSPAEAITQLAIDETTVFVLMTHNYNYDLKTLPFLLQSSTKYIGVLGPKKRLEKMLFNLEEVNHHYTKNQLSVIYGPTGLDIGAEAPEEIALSVLAEIKAVLASRQGIFLRERSDVIHPREKDISFNL